MKKRVLHTSNCLRHHPLEIDIDKVTLLFGPLTVNRAKCILIVNTIPLFNIFSN